MRHEISFHAEQPRRVSRVLPSASASSQRVSGPDKAMPNVAPVLRATYSAPAAPLPSPRPPVRNQAPACAWACTHCTVECSTATNIMRDLVRERAVLVANAGTDLLQPAALARADWEIAQMKTRIDEVRGKAWQAEIDEERARDAAKRSRQRRRRLVIAS